MAGRPETFKREDRLRSSKQFEAIYARGLRMHGRWLMLLVLPNEVGRSRLGVTLSRKVGPAVMRNKARRRLRDIFRRHGISRAEGLDLVVHGKPGIGKALRSELEADLGLCLSRYQEKRRR